jgi:hypothetical protein
MLEGDGRGFDGLSQDEGQEEFVKNLCASPFNEDPFHDPSGWIVKSDPYR